MTGGARTLEAQDDPWRLAELRAPYPFRRHQQESLDAVDHAVAQGRQRAWVVLPPGAGKTLVGLEVVRRCGDKGVVFSPNTAIQGQWMRGWDQFLPTPDHPAGAQVGRGLDGFFNSLTYQSLATFDPEEDEDAPLLQRLHENGRDLVERLRTEEHLTLVLDECHHLLEVWGRLLQEVLDQLPNAFVVALTATPPSRLTRTQQALVRELFGEIVYDVSIPAVVREGDLAPFAELTWLTTPTPTEAEYLAEQAQRFSELTHQLTAPDVGFLQWVDRRFVHAMQDGVSWHLLQQQDTELCDAALRLHHAGLLALPQGARLLEQHRHPPDADDWVLLIEDWVDNHLRETGEDDDEQLVEALKRALPSVGYQWTRRGIRNGRSPVDRVLARSESKTEAAASIIAAEHRNLGERLRMLVLCDHEHATATLPADLTGVMSEQAGTAQLVLERLLTDPGTRDLGPMLVTGRTVAGSAETLQRLIDFVAEGDPALAADLRIEGTRLHGLWRSREWVPWVTRFFEEGHCRALVGTRGLLGEGWDARAVTGLVDLTAATTSAAVVQTRGRALRIDPGWPDKVALTWTVVCVTDQHPNGDNDWERFVRKHQGFYGVDEDGAVVDGVAHVDPTFSPYAPPKVDLFDEVNARMLVRSERRHDIRARWQVGEPYDDTLVHTVRVLPHRRSALGAETTPAPVVVRPAGVDVRDERHVLRPHPVMLGLLGVALIALILDLPGLTVLVATLAAFGVQAVVAARRGGRLVTDAARRPSLQALGAAVADALRDAGLSTVGAEGVRVEVDAEGEYRCQLVGVPAEVSERFATALDEVVSPMAAPRYVLPRWVVDPPAPGLAGLAQGLSAVRGKLRPSGEVWHSVPSVLGRRGEDAQVFARAWDHWVGGGKAIYTGSPEGEGVLATHRGSDPFAVTTVLRLHWR